jgi:hypothetical protein
MQSATSDSLMYCTNLRSGEIECFAIRPSAVTPTHECALRRSSGVTHAGTPVIRDPRQHRSKWHHHWLLPQPPPAQHTLHQRTAEKSIVNSRPTALYPWKRYGYSHHSNDPLDLRFPG